MERRTVLVLNGPNANLVGRMASGAYGTETLLQIEQRCRALADQHALTVDFRQSNCEGQLIDWIQEGRQAADGLIINATGLTYTSIAVLDALLAFEKPIIELHLSNIYKREAFRRHSFVSKAATGIIAGFGPAGYEFAIVAMKELLGASVTAAAQRSSDA